MLRRNILKKKRSSLRRLKKSTNKTVLTCGIILSLPRRSWSPIVDMSIPSIIILPPDLSTILNRQFESVDLPAPVRPTIPICNEMIMNSLHCAFCKGLGPLHWQKIHWISGQWDLTLPTGIALTGMEYVMWIWKDQSFPRHSMLTGKAQVKMCIFSTF